MHRFGFSSLAKLSEAGTKFLNEAVTMIRTYPEVAQYVVPNAYHRRVLAQFNLREAYAFCQLRSAPNAHFSMRRIAGRIYEAIQATHPRLAGFMRTPEESWQTVQQAHFADC